jgi:uncharacterized membrane protein YbaN (DUF454 family)
MKNVENWNLYVLCGWFSFAVGFVGIFLPLLPSVPFFLLTSWCFGKGSVRFHAWILSHKYAGPIIKDWEDYKRISFQAKKKAILTIAISFGISIVIVKSLGLRIMLLMCMLLVTLFILTRKS